MRGLHVCGEGLCKEGRGLCEEGKCYMGRGGLYGEGFHVLCVLGLTGVCVPLEGWSTLDILLGWFCYVRVRSMVECVYQSFWL